MQKYFIGLLVLLSFELTAQIDTCNLSLSFDTIKYPCESNYDGWFTVKAVGGTEPYDYLWLGSDTIQNDTITGLRYGEITVLATDSAGCSIQDTLILERSNHCCMRVEMSIINYPVTPVSNDGRINASLKRNYFPPSNSIGWTWSHDSLLKSSSANSLGLGDYSVSGGFKGCLVANTIRLDSVTYDTCNLGIQIEVVQYGCAGSSNGIIVARPSSGTSPFTYQWNDEDSTQTDTLFDIPLGDYMVAITDARGCIDKSTISTGHSSLDCSCAGVSISVLKHPTDYYSFDGEVIVQEYGDQQGPYPNYRVNNLGPGLHTFSGTPAGCGTKYATVELFVTDTCAMLVEFETVLDTCIGCSEWNITANITKGGTPPYTYLWDDQNEQTTQTATGLNTGNYSVLITDSVGCWIMDTEGICIVCGIFDETIPEIGVYPNPTTGIFRIHADKVEIYNTIGQLIKSTTTQLIDITSYPKGLYYIQAFKDDRMYYSKLLKK